MQIQALTGLRAWLALYVFLYHYKTYADVYTPAINNGRIAVSVFFVLSGAVLTLAQNDNCKFTEKSCFYLYLGKRFARILPLYYLSLLVAYDEVIPIWQNATLIDWIYIVLHLLAMSTWLPLNFIYWNTPCWSVQTEMGFYYAFPFLFKFFKKLNLNKLLFLYFLTFIATLIPSFILISFQGACPGPNKIFAYMLLWARFPEFILGMLSIFLLRKIVNNEKISKFMNNEYTLDLYTLLTITFLLTTSLSTCATNYLAQGFFAIFASLLIPLIIHNENNKINSKTIQFLSSDFCVKGGEISYAVYLFHCIWPTLFLYLGYDLPPLELYPGAKYNSPAYATIYLIFTIGVCSLLHWYYENPIYKFCYSKLKNKYKCECNNIELNTI